MDRNRSIRPKEGRVYMEVPLTSVSVRTEDAEQDAEPDYEIREQDRLLPLANVARVMKSALPPEGKLSKDAKMCVQECVSEFISFVTSGAVDKSQAEKRKTLNGEDVLYALYTLGFQNYAETLKIYLTKYRESERLDADVRREKDRRKRQLRKERKEKEQRESNLLEYGSNGEQDLDTGCDQFDSEFDEEDEEALALESQNLADFSIEAQQDMSQYVIEPTPSTSATGFQDNLSF